MVYITIADLPSLKKSYNKAVKDSKEMFMFNGSQLLTAYAKYLIEYLTTRKEGKK